MRNSGINAYEVRDPDFTMNDLNMPDDELRTLLPQARQTLSKGDPHAISIKLLDSLPGDDMFSGSLPRIVRTAPSDSRRSFRCRTGESSSESLG